MGHIVARRPFPATLLTHLSLAVIILVGVDFIDQVHKILQCAYDSIRDPLIMHRSTRSMQKV